MTLTGLPASTLVALGAALCAVVVLLYLLRLSRRTVEVPFGVLWQAVLAEEQRARLFSRLRQILSLLLALLTVLALVLSLGDPRADRSSEPRTVVLLIDVSASMGATDVAGSRLDEARTRARSRLASRSPAERIVVAAFGSRAVPLGDTDDEDALSTALDALEPRDVAQHEERSLQWALDVLHARDGSSVLVLTDPGFRTPPALAERAAQQGVSVEIERIGAPSAPRNVAVSALAARRYPLDRSRAAILTELWNTGSTPEDVHLELESEGHLVDVRSLRLGPGERRAVHIPDRSGVASTLVARVRLDDGSSDALAADDVAYALLPPRRRSRVLLVADDDIYTSAALLLDEYLDVSEVATAEYSTTSSYDVTVFSSYVPETAPVGPALYLNPDAAHGPLRIDGTIARPRVVQVRHDHPLVRFTSLRDVNIAEALRLRPEASDTVVASSSEGPLLLTGERGGSRFVALAFDPRRSDLPLRAAWPLVLLHSLEWLLDEDVSGLTLPVRTGETWHVRVPDDATRAWLEASDGRRTNVPFVDGEALATADLRGLYTLHVERASGEPFVHPLAASLGPSDESLLGSVDTRAVGAASTAPDDASTATLAVLDAPWASEPPFRALIALAILLLVFEAIAFHRRWTV